MQFKIQNGQNCPQGNAATQLQRLSYNQNVNDNYKQNTQQQLCESGVQYAKTNINSNQIPPYYNATQNSCQSGYLANTYPVVVSSFKNYEYEKNKQINLGLCYCGKCQSKVKGGQIKLSNSCAGCNSKKEAYVNNVEKQYQNHIPSRRQLQLTEQQIKTSQSLQRHKALCIYNEQRAQQNCIQCCIAFGKCVECNCEKQQHIVPQNDDKLDAIKIDPQIRLKITEYQQQQQQHNDVQKAGNKLVFYD